MQERNKDLSCTENLNLDSLKQALRDFLLMRYNSSSLCGHGLSVPMNPLVWVLKWCNPDHIALKFLSGPTDRMLMITMDYNTSDWAPSDSLNIFVNTFVCAHSSRGKMREQVHI